MKATPFGGLFVLEEFLNQVGFERLFGHVFGKYRRMRNHRPDRIVTMAMATIASGGERLYDVCRFEDDPVIPDLFEMKTIPKDTTFRDEFAAIGVMDDRRRELIFRLHEDFFRKQKTRIITLDIDGSALPVDGHQEGALKGYCPQEPGSRCFQTLTAICDETETALSEQTYPGNTKWDTADLQAFLKPILDRFSPLMDRIVLRLDAGMWSGKLILFLETYKNVIYLIDKPKHAPLQEKIKTLVYKSYHGSERQYSVFCEEGSTRYHYVERTKLPAGTQTDLFESDGYFYRVVVCNEKRQPHIVFRRYNQRGRVEKHFEELKNQYALGKMVSRNFSVTKALCWLSYLTFTIMGMLRFVAFRKQMAKYRLRRLRFILFTTMASLAKHSGQVVLNIALSRITPWKFNGIMDRIWAY